MQSEDINMLHVCGKWNDKLGQLFKMSDQADCRSWVLMDAEIQPHSL